MTEELRQDYKKIIDNYISIFEDGGIKCPQPSRKDYYTKACWLLAQEKGLLEYKNLVGLEDDVQRLKQHIIEIRSSLDLIRKDERGK